MSVRRVAQGLALTTIVTPGAAWCLGLGDITVDTALNQPLRAEIRLLSVTPDELDNMRVFLAPQETFERIGIQRPFVLSQLQFKPVQAQDGGTVVEVTTKQPVREPFLNFLVEVEWPNGRLLREYTVLLDPPVLMNKRNTAGVQTPMVAATAAPSKTAAEASRGAPIRANAPVENAAQAPVNVAGSRSKAGRPGSEPVDYTVVAGDTLGEIAEQYRAGEDLSLSQMMVAVLRANPDAFARENINNLKTGVILRIPASDKVAALSSQEAFAEVARQNSLWREYRAQVEAAVPSPVIDELDAASPEFRDAGEQASADQAGGPAQDARAGVASDGRLKIMASDDGGADAEATIGSDSENAGPLQMENARAQELAESRRVQIESLQSKTTELESIVAKQERLISLQTEALAELQARVDGSQAAEPIAVQDAPDAANGDITAEGAEALGVAVANKSIPSAEAAQDVVSQQPMDNDLGAGVDNSARPQQAGPEANPLDEVAEPVQSASLLEDILANPAMLAGVGVGAVLLLALIWLVVRRGASTRAETIDLASYESESVDGAFSKIDSAPVADVPDVADDVAVASQTAATSTSWKEAQTTAAAGASPPRTEEAVQPENAAGDDTLAEADVYIAYGLQQQAEDLLKEAIRRSPNNSEYRLKLLEVYHAGKRVAAYEAEARALHQSLGHASGDVWKRVVTMGMELSPRNPLFAGAASAMPSPTPMQPQVASPELDFDVPEDAHDAVSATPRDDHFLNFDADLEATALADLPAPASATVVQLDEAALDFDLADLDLGGDDAQAHGEKRSTQGSSAVLDEHQHQTDGVGNVRTFAKPGADESEMLATDGHELEFDAQIAALSDGTVLELDGDLNAASLDASPADDEIGTKLDLARAYLDMGDADGALSTLEEVLQEGNDHQRHEAEVLMRRIA